MPLTILTGSVRCRCGFVGSMVMSFATYLGSGGGGHRGTQVGARSEPRRGKTRQIEQVCVPAKTALAVTST